MTGKVVREAIAPAYLFCCLMLGGSAQGIWVNALLQLLAIAIIAWAATTSGKGELGIPARQLLAVCAAGLLVILIQVIPLPPSIWSALPGRQFIQDGYGLIGQPLPWMALTLTPDETLTTVLRLLPPVAVLAAMLCLNAYRRSWLAWALIGGTGAGVILGALQVASGGGSDSQWYLYPISNFGTAVGFFANSNHMALLLVVSMPFIFALIAAGRRSRDNLAVQRRSAMFALAVGMLVLVILGLILNQSLAGFALGIPVLAASTGLVLSPRRQRRWLFAPALLLLAAVGSIFLMPASAKLQSLGASKSVESRRAIAETSWMAAKDYMPLGSGLGSFENVYRLYENPGSVDATYVNHAHDDYLEIAIEAGVPGLVWIALFLAWWVATAGFRWREAVEDPFAKAGAIASAALLAHSLVDFPLRTSALAAVFAVSIGLMAHSLVRRPGKTESDIRPPRHLEIR